MGRGGGLRSLTSAEGSHQAASSPGTKAGAWRAGKWALGVFSLGFSSSQPEFPTLAPLLFWLSRGHALWEFLVPIVGEHLPLAAPHISASLCSFSIVFLQENCGVLDTQVTESHYFATHNVFITIVIM